MFKKLLVLTIFLNALSVLEAHNPTWAKDIAPILYKNCTNCHHAGGLATFSLLTYNDAYNNRLSIKASVLAKHMPPWPPNEGYNKLAHARTLSADDIEHIKLWVDNFAPFGNAADAPPVPTYTNRSPIVNPNVSYQIPTYTVPPITSDLYRCFPLPSNMTVDNFLTSIDVQPGNASIVHHVLIYADTSSRCYQLDAADPGPGYTSFGGIGSNSAVLIGSWVPGSQPYILPPNMGVRVAARSNIVIQVHYPVGSSGQVDSTKMLAKSVTSGLRQVYIVPILNHSTSLIDGPLVIPANTTRTFHEQFTNSLTDATLIAIAPHMHLVGKSIKSYFKTPTGDTVNMIKIDDWDFHWQGSYSFKKAVKLPRGSTLYAEAFYDNTTANPRNPSNPPRNVQLGEATTDEMMLIYFSFLAYQPGDENIIIDSTATVSAGNQEINLQKIGLKIFPNPIKDDVNIQFELPMAADMNAVIYDLEGKIVKTLVFNQPFSAGKNDWKASLTGLPSGTYFLKMSSEGYYGVEKIIKL
jgi:hypothetical protein